MLPNLAFTEILEKFPLACICDKNINALKYFDCKQKFPGTQLDIIKNKKTGLLCDGNSHEDIYKSLMLIMENNNYKVFGDNAKNYAKLFAWENQIKKYIDLIKKH